MGKHFKIYLLRLKKFLLMMLLLLISVTGCSGIYARYTCDFIQMEESSQIYYEAGAEDLAKEISNNFAGYVKSVEKQEYIPFKTPGSIKIYVFNKRENYLKYTFSSRSGFGSALTNEIYLSPILKERLYILPNVLMHELSHVHLRQYIGTWVYTTNIPDWFHEGFADLTSSGGAERRGTREAIEYINSGHHFAPTTAGSIFVNKTAQYYGLWPHIYYRQAGLFVRFLKQVDPKAFEKSYVSLTEKEDFEEVWKKYYGKSVNELWNQFLIETKK